MQKYIQNQIHKYTHTQPAGKQECFLHICKETIEYYNQGMFTKADIVSLMEQFIQFKELLQDKHTRHIIGIAGMLEMPEEFATKTHKEIITELISQVSYTQEKMP
ncbi:MAG: hypothetical protein M3Q44_07915 [bacterium]|nr:hypothetical protein [bacterium]